MFTYLHSIYIALIVQTCSKVIKTQLLKEVEIFREALNDIESYESNVKKCIFHGTCIHNIVDVYCRENVWSFTIELIALK